MPSRPQGADADAQPRLGRLAHHRRRGVQASSSTPATACSPSTSAASASPAATRTSRTPTSRATTSARWSSSSPGASGSARTGPGDPRLGAIGGSYGGGYQFLAAFEELRLHGKPIFDALAPEITWHDLSQSLAPERRRPHRVGARPQRRRGARATRCRRTIYKALVEGVRDRQWPDGSIPGTENLNEFFEKNGPRWHIRHGRKLDIPVLFGQGMTDGLFNAQQGLDNWRTRDHRARPARQSIFVGYNGGHVLPAVFPQGVNVTSDPCSKQLAGGDFPALTLRFFDEQLKGKDDRPHGLQPAAPGDARQQVRDRPLRPREQVVRRRARSSPPTTAGVPTVTEIAAGPIRVAGLPHVTAKVTSSSVGLADLLRPRGRHQRGRRQAGPEQRDAAARADPGHRRCPGRFTLPAVAVDVPAGQTLFLLATPVSDTVRRHGQPPPGSDHARQHDGSPPRCAAQTDLLWSACRSAGVWSSP